MTEEQIKEMLNGIINNGEKWEYRWCTADGWSNWKDYKLGDEIYDGYEYRKVPLFCVVKIKDSEYVCGYKNALIVPEAVKIFFEGTKEECEKWIEEHTKKSWLEEYMKSTCSNKLERDNTKIDITEVCKKILEEADKEVGLCSASYYLKLIIKDLGIDL